jgi:uncharacterized protein YbbK (DUF523 family)
MQHAQLKVVPDSTSLLMRSSKAVLTHSEESFLVASVLTSAYPSSGAHTLRASPQHTHRKDGTGDTNAPNASTTVMFELPTRTNGGAPSSLQHA